ncbi:MAG: hypothetical protein P4L83_15425 [Nevskia sp.]|nr:hypothetical protein [Nevskia sp.]
MTKAQRLAGIALSAAFVTLAAAPASAETLFKIVTVKDDITVGLNDAELKDLGGDAGGIAKAIAAKGSLTLWQYAVTRNKDGDSVVAPRAKIGVLANSSLRVEPYKQPFTVLPHE